MLCLLPELEAAYSGCAMWAEFPWSSALSLLALACSGLAVVVSSRRSPSGLVQQSAKLAQETVTAWGQERQLFEATRERWSQEFSGIADRCDELLDRTESKRRRVAATESRSGGQAPQPANAAWWDGQPRDAVLAQARRMRGGG